MKRMIPRLLMPQWHDPASFSTSGGIKPTFSEHAELPRLPNIDSVKESPPPRSKSKEPPTRKTDDKAAALAFARE